MSERNLVNVKDVEKGYASRSVLRDVTLGIAAGDRIGIVGRNGDGKSTLLKLLAGQEEPDGGQVIQTRGLGISVLGQGDDLDPARTVRHQLVGDRPDHEWASDARFRTVLDGLLGGVGACRFPNGMDTVIGPLSGGERRRIALVRLLLGNDELLLLDEPTNHLDVEGVTWLAHHLAARRGALVVVTHDRWFLDAVCTHTWEVSDGSVHRYEGGYAAYVLARAERDRQAAARDDRRQQLIRKELAWLRRGPPARTAKPKFRIEAANALIADEPDPRDAVELLRFSTSRLGSKVLDAVNVGVTLGERRLLHDITWRLGPGQRVGLVGVNGSGKSTLLRVLSGDVTPSPGRVETGQTVRLGFLTQEAAELPGDVRVLESLEQIRGRTTTSDGREMTAGMLCDRFGFRGERAYTRVRELSGGERRRLQLMRLLMQEPNVLLLDEPTNDLDIDTLTAVEDLLDGWPGTLIVVSHDRYFVERVCDDVYAIGTDGEIRHMPGGIDQYLETRSADVVVAPSPIAAPASTGAELHAARKDVQRAERAMAKLDAREAELYELMAAAATDHSRLGSLQDEVEALAVTRDEQEAAWLAASELLDGATR